MKIKSPVTGSKNVLFEREISVKFITELYKKQLGINVSKYFSSGVDSVSIYRCLDTGYRFYFPFKLAGDKTLYQKLEKFPWYYMGWKWEHDIASKIIKKSDNILEIGCAAGSFLEKIAPSCHSVTGLETNTRALARGKKRGIKILNQTVQEFASANRGKYNAVFSFQVLEHIYNVKSFIVSSLTVLKPGGKLVISVPNNDCLLIMGQDTPLNLPPHHMGLWNLNSLLKLQDFFAMNIQSAYLEPLQKYHLSFATRIADREIKKKLRQKFGPLSPLFEDPSKQIIYTGISAIRDSIIGHTVLAVFQKNA